MKETFIWRDYTYFDLKAPEQSWPYAENQEVQEMYDDELLENEEVHTLTLNQSNSPRGDRCRTDTQQGLTYDFDDQRYNDFDGETKASVPDAASPQWKIEGGGLLRV